MSAPRSRAAGKALIGYTDQPTAMQLAVHLAVLAVPFVLMRLYGAPERIGTPARSCAAFHSSLSL